MPDYIVNTSNTVTTTTTNTNHLSAVVSGRANLDVVVPNAPTLAVTIGPNPLVPVMYVAGPQGPHGPPGPPGSGITSINGLSGIVNIYGTGNIAISTAGQSIYVSGINLANSGDISTLSNRIQQTGSYLYHLLTGVSGGFTGGAGDVSRADLSGVSGVLQSQITSLSGYTNALVAATGQAAWTHSQNNATNLSGVIAQTGATLYQRDLDISGVLQAQINANPSGYITTGQTGQFYPASNPQAYATSGDLVLSGNAAINHANGIGVNLSGDLTQTGSYLYNQTTGLSGYVIDLISAASAGVAAINGASGVLSIVGTGAISVITAGQTIWISGDLDAGAYATTAYVTGVSGALTTCIEQTGQAAVAYANTIGVNLSGSLTGVSGILQSQINDLPTSNQLYQTGSNLYNLVTGLSGQATTDYATKTQLIQTGIDLIARDLAISGVLNQQIADTGQQAWSAAQNNALNLSGNLTQTGVVLGSKIDGLSGYINSQDYQSGRAAVLYASGVSGSLQSQISALVTSGNLQATGQQLYAIITGLSGQAVVDYATKTQLTQTGSALDNKINSLSGFVGLVLGGLEARIAASGNAAVNHANGIGVNLSGNLTQTGSRLFNLVTGLSGIMEGTFVHRTGNETISGNKQFLNGLGTSGVNFNGVSGSGIFLQVETQGGVSFYGTGAGGALLSIQDNATGSIFAVTNLYEAPIFEVFDDGRVIAGAFNANTLFVSGQGVAFGVNYVPTGKVVFISGDTQYLGNIFSGDRNIWDIYYPRTNPSGFITGLAGTGSLATLAQLNSLSGYVNFQDAATGSAAVNHANSIGQIISGNLTVTGQTLFNIITGLSGQANTDYATKIQLTTTGQTLDNKINAVSGWVGLVSDGLEVRIAATGTSAVTHANSVGVNLSGNLTLTGQTLINKINSLSGFTLGVSGALQTLIDNSNADVNSVNGQSGALILAGTGGLTVLSGAAGLILVSGDSSISGALTQSGVLLGAKIDALSGFVGQVSGGLETRITQSGGAAISYANGIGVNLSGNLTLTGQTLYQLTTGLSGSFNAQIIQTGASVINYVNGMGSILSGNLTATGQALSAVKVSGSSVINVADFSGAGNVVVYSAGGKIIVSGINTFTGSTAQIFTTGVPSGVSGFYINYPTGLATVPVVITQNQSRFDSIYTTSLQSVSKTGFNLVLSAPTTGANDLFVNVYAVESGSPWVNTSGRQMFTSGVASGVSGFYVNYPVPFQTVPVVITNLDCINQTLYAGGLQNVSKTGFGYILSSHVTGVELAINVMAVESGQYFGLGTAGGGIASATNIGIGSGIFKSTVLNEIQLFSLAGSGGVSIELSNNTYYVNASTLSGRVDSLSGAMNATSGVLFSAIAQTGQAAWSSANGAASTLSGNLIATGQTLQARITGLSGVMESMFVHRSGNEIITGRKQFLNGLGTSGVNFNGISGSGIFLQVETQGGVSYYGTGASGSLLSIEDNSSGSIFAVTDNYEAPILEVFDDGRIVGGYFNSNALFVSGAGVAFGVNNVPTGFAVFISGNTQYIGHIYSGTTNISDIFYPRNNPSGYVTGLSLIATGNAAIAHANSIGQTISGNLTQTGITLFARDAAISGGLEARITATGNAAISYANGIGINLSGNLTTTGATLYAFITGGSGVMNATFVNTVFTTGQQVISGIKFFNSGDYQSQKTVSANYSVSPNDSRLYCNNSSPITLTFGSAVTNSGQLVKIKLINTGAVYLTGTFTQKFDGADSYILAGQYNAYEIHANGMNWYLW